jgi:hypothetical protein
MAGRPSKYTKELGDLVCEGISDGHSLVTVCKGDDMPSPAAVFCWMREHPEFEESFKKAQEERTELQNEMLLEIGDDAVRMAELSIAPAAVVSAMKLKADNFKWVMSKMKPKKFGDKVDITTDGKAFPTPIYNGKAE